MRKLKTSDVFAAVRIIKKADIREEVKRIAASANAGNVSIQDLGVDMLLGVAEGLANTGAEKLLYEFFGGLFEMDPAALEDNLLIDTLELFMQYKDVEDKERWKAFFHVVAKLLK